LVYYALRYIGVIRDEAKENQQKFNTGTG
jgi:hypothetical protein